MTLLLLNKERVVFELMELGRLRIARELKIKPDAVHGKVALGDDQKLHVELSLDPEAVKFRDVAQMQEVLKKHYFAVRVEMQKRFQTINQRWSDGREDEKEAAAEAAPTP